MLEQRLDLNEQKIRINRLNSARDLLTQGEEIVARKNTEHVVIKIEQSEIEEELAGEDFSGVNESKRREEEVIKQPESELDISSKSY